MLKKILFLAFAALAVTLAMSSKAHAWGCYHAGFTHVGPTGVYHVGGTRAYGGYGGYGAAYHYGGYHYGGYGYGYHPYGAAAYGYNRRW